MCVSLTAAYMFRIISSRLLISSGNGLRIGRGLCAVLHCLPAWTLIGFGAVSIALLQQVCGFGPLCSKFQRSSTVVVPCTMEDSQRLLLKCLIENFRGFSR